MKPYNINKDWRIRADSNGTSYLLECRQYVPDSKPKRQSKDKDGKLVWHLDGYYLRIDQAVRGFLDAQTRQSSKHLPEALGDAVRDADRLLRELREELDRVLVER